MAAISTVAWVKGSKGFCSNYIYTQRDTRPEILISLQLKCVSGFIGKWMFSRTTDQIITSGALTSLHSCYNQEIRIQLS